MKAVDHDQPSRPATASNAIAASAAAGSPLPRQDAAPTLVLQSEEDGGSLDEPGYGHGV